MSTSHFSLMILAVLLLLANAISTVAAAQQSSAEDLLTLAQDAQTSYRIALGESASPIARHAADELGSYLQQISGATFHQIREEVASDGPLVIVGRENSLTATLCPDIDFSAVGDDGFVYCTAGQNIVIAGATPRGTLYGVYYFLDRLLGVRWYAPDFTYVPQLATLQIPVKQLNQVQVPRFAGYREIMAADGNDPQYRQHNLLNGEITRRRNNVPVPPELDTWSTFFADRTHTFEEAVRKEHPEFAVGNQIALMSSGVRKAAADYFTHRIASMPDYQDIWLGLSQRDGGWAKPDTLSADFAAKHSGALSAPLMDMVIDVAKQVREVYPEAKFSTLAYDWSFTPPTGMEIPDYVQVTVAPIKADRFQALTGPGNPEIAADIAQWAAIANNIVVWDYLTNFKNYLMPNPNLDAMCQSIQGLADYPSIKGYFGQSSNLTEGGEFAELRTWVAARLLWNPDQDYQELIDEFVKGYYGPAAPYINAYLALMHQAARATDAKFFTMLTPTDSLYSLETMRQADELLAQAEEAVAGQPNYLKNVKTVRVGVDYVILVRRGDYATQAKLAGIDWNPNTQARLARFRSSVYAAGITQYREVRGDLSKLFEEVAVGRTSPPDPELVEDLPDTAWVDIQETEFSLGGKNADARVVADPLASNSAAAVMTDGWAIRLKFTNLPAEGEWKIYAMARVEGETGLTFAAYPGGNKTIKSTAEMADGAYHLIELPGTYRNGKGYAYFTRPKTTPPRFVYVDRLIAIDASYLP